MSQLMPVGMYCQLILKGELKVTKPRQKQTYGLKIIQRNI